MAAHTDELDHTSIYGRDPNDSEESDGEGGLGNLNRLIVRPPGHSGKAKRGHLCFDAAFECGNLGRADHITELEYDLYIRPDTCRPRSRFWFNFTVENVKQDQRVIFNIVNFGKERILYNSEMTPIVRSTSRPKWQRIPRRLIFYQRSLVHRGRHILSIAFGFDREEDVYQFAASPPYSYSRLQKHISLWEKKANTFATRETIAQTTQKRRVDLITIGDMKSRERDKEDMTMKTKSNETKQRLVLIIARSHGGDQPSSFICQGFLDYMVSSSEKAVALRNSIVIQIIPMLNPDGVFLGNHRSDLLGSDLNRCWNNATSYAHPALVAVSDLLKKINAEKNLQLDFIIDVHADISHEGVFVRGNSYDDVYRFERHAVLPKFLSARVEAWKTECCLYNTDGNSAGTARRALPTGSVDGYSLIASLGGRRLNARGPYMHYTEDDCSIDGQLWFGCAPNSWSVRTKFERVLQLLDNSASDCKIGRSLAKALCDYYRHIGVIAPRAGVPSKKTEARGRRRRKRPVIERERSFSSSPERSGRVVRARVVSPPLPAATPPAPRVPRTAFLHARVHASRAKEPQLDHLLPYITGIAVRTPRLSVVDLSAYIRSPCVVTSRGAPPRSAPRLRGTPAPSTRQQHHYQHYQRGHYKLTSDEYDTHESDS